MFKWMKALKLHPFNEDKDILDAYLIRIERPCISTTRRRWGWSLWWKAQLLKRFRLTEKTVKPCKLEPGETPAQFAEKLKRYLEKWRIWANLWRYTRNDLERSVSFDMRQIPTYLFDRKGETVWKKWLRCPMTKVSRDQSFFFLDAADVYRYGIHQLYIYIWYMVYMM